MVGQPIRARMTTGAQTLAGRGQNERKHPARQLMPALFGLLLVACAQTDTQLERSSLARGVAAQEAIALLPPGGPSIAGIVERRYSNAIQQDIALTTRSAVSGQNLLRVQIFGPVGREGGETPLVDRRLHDAELRREMRAQFPGVAMQRSPLYTQNGYGPFGYATGTSGADLCLYAWQRIAGSRNGAPFGNLGTVQVRLRICQAGASERGLLALMYGYTINASFGGENWNPYGTPQAADPRLGSPGQVIVPGSSTGFDTMLDAPAPPREQAVRRVAAPPPQAPVRPVLPAPPPGAPLIPPPPAAQAEPAPVVPPPPPGQ
ncbi:cellulose biosynthesis protein BcsN [Mesorhizobium microcysteis]|uniref:Cellulose biosynthesis protein BcsN n=2 Tax=Neoaquamicrobium microcysteis TaxID=2682781 RepID=A0A5D4GQP2_9HYPH|nr:cellulose biosynthesis protein BcsN [Mesorhizobium microcysteis]